MLYPATLGPNSCFETATRLFRTASPRPDGSLDMAETPASSASETRAAGDLPPWRVADLPEPLPFNVKNLFRTIGPGAILLATSIGGGEWLVGPTAGVKHGLSVFWI